MAVVICVPVSFPSQEDADAFVEWLHKGLGEGSFNDHLDAKARGARTAYLEFLKNEDGSLRAENAEDP